MTKNVQTVSRSVVVDAVFKAVKKLPYIKGKWWVEYIPHEDWIALASIKSGMGITLPLIITINNGVVELRTDESEWAFYRHLPDESDWVTDNKEIIDILSSVLEDELNRFISRYWAKK